MDSVHLIVFICLLYWCPSFCCLSISLRERTERIVSFSRILHKPYARAHSVTLFRPNCLSPCLLKSCGTIRRCCRFVFTDCLQNLDRDFSAFTPDYLGVHPKVIIVVFVTAHIMIHSDKRHSAGRNNIFEQ